MIPSLRHYCVKPAACGGIRNWEGVTTTTQFPIQEGETVTLTCEQGLSHVGDSVVTCNQLYYESYKYTFRPKCEVGDSGSDVVTGNLASIMQFSQYFSKNWGLSRRELSSIISPFILNFAISHGLLTHFSEFQVYDFFSWSCQTLWIFTDRLSRI